MKLLTENFNHEDSRGISVDRCRALLSVSADAGNDDITAFRDCLDVLANLVLDALAKDLKSHEPEE